MIEWSDNGKYIIAAGKMKSRKKWNEDEDDNFIVPCPLKVITRNIRNNSFLNKKYRFLMC